jgi:DNA polymerase-3 subunit epsilon
VRQIVLDTETTGLETRDGHRIIEIGAVELLDRKLTGRHYHQYIHPDREIDEGAQEVHGITLEFLADKPRFAQIEKDFMDFVDGDELVIHNAAFDVGFINHELTLAGQKFPAIDSTSSVVDSLMLARAKHPGQKNNLDALCKRYGIDNSHRELHGALLDAEILADVYLALTGGQVDLGWGGDSSEGGESISVAKNMPIEGRTPGLVVRASEAELAAHAEQLAAVDKASGGECVWLKQTS